MNIVAFVRNRNVSAQSVSGTSNPYLANESAGLSLVAKIVSSTPYGRNKAYYTVDQLIDNELLSFSGNLELSNELDLYNRLMSLSDRLRIPAKYHLLKNRAVVGLGGKFSAGKSEFINSVLGRQELLPTAQTPTTSVPTYIISGDADRVSAYSTKGAHISLDSDAVKAISHDFQNTYGLGLAQYLSFITVSVSDFRPDLALLDTPGYNKSDSGLIEAYSDSEKAYSQLRSSDYLIWLIDAENGTLTEDDIRFLRRLDLKTKILIVINKCDLKSDSVSRTVAEQTRTAALNAGIPLFDVVRYSSWYPEHLDGNERIKNFFDYTTEAETKIEDIRSQINEIATRIDEAFKQTHDRLEEQRNSIGNAIFRATNVLEIKALVSMYGKFNSEISIIGKNHGEFQRTRKKIYEMLNGL